MVHINIIPGRGSRLTDRALALLPIMFMAFSGFAQDATLTNEAAAAASAATEEEMSQGEIIGYIASAIGFIAMIVGAWFLTSKKPKGEPMPTHAHPPGMRVSSAHTNDPYMRRKVIKKTN